MSKTFVFSRSYSLLRSNRAPHPAADYSATEHAIDLPDCIKKNILCGDLFHVKKNHRIFSQKISRRNLLRMFDQKNPEIFPGFLEDVTCQGVRTGIGE
jgi:hypothetical protein